MILIKPGVIFKQLRPEIYGLFSILDRTWANYGQQCVITSANDGRHKTGSLHYHDLALDVRTKNLGSDSNKKAAALLLAHELGGNYDVILESLGEVNEHIHIEFDPAAGAL